MAELSNQLMVVTVLAYLAAMICHAAEYSFGARSHIGRAAARPARQLVGAGAPVPPADDVTEEPEAPERDWGAVLGLFGLMLSLWGHRRRVWFRVSPLTAGDAGHGGSVMEAGGLPRTDYPHFGEEFAQLVKAARDEGTS